MKKRILLIAMAAMTTILAAAQAPADKKGPAGPPPEGAKPAGPKPVELTYYDVKELGLPIIGQAFQDRVADSEGNGYYSRIAADLKGKVRDAVWDLGKNSSGLATRFKSDASTISLKWTLITNFRMNHMTPTGICGFDLYTWYKGEWRFVCSARPGGKESTCTIIRGMKPEMREYLLYFPLYDGVTKVEIGVNPEATVAQAESIGANPFGGDALKPLVFYGTSITQGGCANRPGMSYTNILTRMLKRECINLGFSGNGRMDSLMAGEIAKIDDAGAIVIDCLGNCSMENTRDSSDVFLKTILDAHRDIPVIMLTNYPYVNTWLSDAIHKDGPSQNEIWRQFYEKYKAMGYDNLQFIDIRGGSSEEYPMKNAITGPDDEATVDGTHLTDLGFQRVATALYPYLKDIK